MEKLLQDIARLDESIAKGDPRLTAIYQKMKEGKLKQIELLKKPLELESTDEIMIQPIVKQEIMVQSVVEAIKNGIEEGKKEINTPLTVEDIVRPVVTTTANDLTCTCGKICATKAGLSAHKRFCKQI